MKKLSGPMEDMIKGATLHTVRVDGEVVKVGYIVAGKSNTVCALIDRDVCTTSDAANYGVNWLTETPGMAQWSRITGNDAAEAIVECAAARHYANATSDDSVISDYQGAAYVASKEALMIAAAVAFPDLSAAEFNDLFGESYSPGDLADLVHNFRADRDAAASEDHPVSGMITDHICGTGSEAICDACIANETDYCDVEPEDRAQYDMETSACSVCREGARCKVHASVATWLSSVRAEAERDAARDIAAEREEAQDAWHDSNPTVDYINAELDAAMFISRTITDDDIMIRTSRTFVSQAYMNTVYRIRAYSAAQRQAWRDMQEIMINMGADAFMKVDEMVLAGEISFRQADKSKRILKQIIRPTLGGKRKPGKHKR